MDGLLTAWEIRRKSVARRRIKNYTILSVQPLSVSPQYSSHHSPLYLRDSVSSFPTRERRSVPGFHTFSLTARVMKGENFPATHPARITVLPSR